MAEKKQSKQNYGDFNQLAYALLAFAVAYAFASWAIDTGSLVGYSLCVIAAYYGGRFVMRFHKSLQPVKKSKKQHGKRRTAKRAKK